MLAKYYRFHCQNNTGQDMVYNTGSRIDVRAMPWKVTDGAIAYGTVITDNWGTGHEAGDTLSDGNAVESEDVQNNSVNLYIGLKGYFEVTTHNASSDGPVCLYVEESDANGSDWPSDQADFDCEQHCRLLCVMQFDDADTRGKNFEL